MAPNTLTIDDDRFREAKAEEEKYAWQTAGQIYTEILREKWSDRYAELTHLTGLLARCHFKSAFQAENREEFRRRMQLARTCYEDLASIDDKLGLEGPLRMAKARGLFADFWLSENFESRRILIEKCILLCHEAAAISEKQSDRANVAETHRMLVNYHLESLHLLSDGRSLVKRFREAIDLGPATVVEWEGLDEHGEEVVEILHSTLWILTVLAQVLLEPAEFESLADETAALEAKLSRLSEKLRTAYAESLSKEIAGNIAFTRKDDPSKALNLFEDSLSAARTTGDSLTIGRLLAFMGLAELWRAYGEEYADSRRGILEHGVKLGEEAEKALGTPFHTSYLAAASDAVANCQIEIATLVETEREKKQDWLKGAVAESKAALTLETHTWGWQRVAHSLTKAMYFLASLEPDGIPKRELLENTLRTRKEIVRVTDSLAPNSWSAGVMRNYLALIRSEVAGLEPNTNSRKELLTDAVSDMSQCLGMCAKWRSFPGFSYQFATYAERYGDVLVQLYKLTTDSNTGRRALEFYRQAAESFEKSGARVRIAELNWKIGMVYDALADFREASETLKGAAENYRAAAKSMPKLASSFEELGDYMDAWSTIEQARLQHAREDYSNAGEQYVIAGKKLQHTKNREYLAMICVARSFIEKGEDLSEQEKHEQSIESFNTALEMFRRARLELESRLKTSTQEDEKNELTQWLRLTNQRERFSLGRIELEEAKILDMQGQKLASSRKYDSAAENFRTMASQIENAEDRRELETFSQFCEAWARMKEAESKVSPEMYAEAAESFLKAKTIASQERLGLLALASAAICRALEYGTRFRLTRNAKFYPEVKTQLETAADYYQEAGFRKAGTWTRATQRLFDALFYLTEAESERDTRKKSELYYIAEKTLELAAKLYGDAGFPSKKREALDRIEQVREQKELLVHALVTLSEIPTSTGTLLASAFLKGTPPPLGLERLENANVVGNLNVPTREAHVGSDLILEVELANVGRSTAMLLKLENVVPEGFEIETEKNRYRVENRSIDMRGKRLEHLKTEQIKLVLKPSRKGIVDLRPSILFADEKGNFRKQQLGPLELKVGELGVSGWVGSPGKKEAELSAAPSPTDPSNIPPLPPLETAKQSLPEELHFESERAREVFQKLVKEFLRDYMSRRLYIDAAGWRSLMDLVGMTNLPRSALYGPEGKDGPVLAELEHRGLIETRIFPGERGRGGEVKKIRVAYGNAIVNTIVERAAMQNT